MNLISKLTKNEIQLLKDAEINVENREYNKDELRKYEVEVEDFVMSHSSKNGDVSKFSNKYSDVLEKLIKFQQD